MPELGSNNATVTVRPHHSSPHHSDFIWRTTSFGMRVTFRLLHSVHERNPLAHVELGLFTSLHTLDFDQRRVWALGVQTTLVAKDYALRVQSERKRPKVTADSQF